MMGWTVDGSGAKHAGTAGLRALSCNGSGVACAKHTPFPDGLPRAAAGGLNSCMLEPGCTEAHCGSGQDKRQGIAP